MKNFPVPSKDEMDLFLDFILNSPSAKIFPTNANQKLPDNYSNDRAYQICEHMANLKYLLRGGISYHLTDKGIDTAMAGGILAIERKKEEDQRKADAIHDITMRASQSAIDTNENVRQTNQSIISANQISTETNKSVLNVNKLFKVTLLIAGISAAASVISIFKGSEKDIQLNVQLLQDSMSLQVNNKIAKTELRLSAQQNSIDSLSALIDSLCK